MDLQTFVSQFPVFLLASVNNHLSHAETNNQINFHNKNEWLGQQPDNY